MFNGKLNLDTPEGMALIQQLLPKGSIHDEQNMVMGVLHPELTPDKKPRLVLISTENYERLGRNEVALLTLEQVAVLVKELPDYIEYLAQNDYPLPKIDDEFSAASEAVTGNVDPLGR